MDNYLRHSPVGEALCQGEGGRCFEQLEFRCWWDIQQAGGHTGCDMEENGEVLEGEWGGSGICFF